MQSFKVSAIAFSSLLKLFGLGLSVVFAPFFCFAGIGALLAWDFVTVRGWSGPVTGWQGLLVATLVYVVAVALVSVVGSVLVWGGLRCVMQFRPVTLRMKLRAEE